MRGPVKQAGHILYEVGYFVFSLVSRIINAVFYKGSMHQTLSSRSHIEGRTSDVWNRRERRINDIFFWQPDHCSTAWQAEVDRATKTLSRNNIGEIR
jgi:hypothetical protein